MGCFRWGMGRLLGSVGLSPGLMFVSDTFAWHEPFFEVSL